MTAQFHLLTTPRYDKQLLQVRERHGDYPGWNFHQESPIYMWDYHHKRLLKGAKYFGWKAAVQALETHLNVDRFAKEIDNFVGPCPETPLRLRILLSPEGSVHMEKYGISATGLENLFPESLDQASGPDSPETMMGPKATPMYTLVVDRERTKSSVHTRFKTTLRDVYDAARQRALLTPSENVEVLLVNEDNGHVMEGSITTPYFSRGGRWVTPPVPKELDDVEGSGGQDGVSRRWALDRGLAVEEPVSVESLVDGEACWISNGARGFMRATVKLTDAQS
ncbi:unnamed protein product [Clonostachys rhizophaga]|uniref:Aminodeoxychorismate lyase n=1 Tax=Clonostachys rhizophaga TaxID=160324 RepID=A0A9N9UXQ5_9HYPO|nr:unnamed protein product [Clonostachys rhizophaga]